MSMLRSLANLFSRDITGRTWTREREHEYFSKLTYFGSKTPSDCYWEAELNLPESPDVRIGVTMAGTPEGPTLEEQRFCQSTIADPDGLFARCRGAFEGEFERWASGPIPHEWRMAFRLDGFQVPARGDPNEPWEVCYFVVTAKHYFTAAFESCRVKHVTVDG